LGLLELLAADGASLNERFETLHLLTPVLNVRFGSRSARLSASHGRLLFIRIDLNERGSSIHTLAGFHEDARDDAVDFRLDGGGTPGLNGGDEFGRLFDGFRFECDDFDTGRRQAALRALCGW
jgi:hypothetical protein